MQSQGAPMRSNGSPASRIQGLATARAGRTRKRTRIQEANEARILDAALKVFSGTGFRGATVDAIATAAGMTKPNLLYYFRRKEDIYLAVLERTLEAWLQPLEELSADGDPAEEITAYVERKLELARDNPPASRLFAMEIMHGAPVLGGVLAGRLKRLVEEKVAVLRRWMEAGALAPVDPYHFIFMIWATTQHYADFEIQIRALLGDRVDTPEHFETARRTLDRVLVRGVVTG